MYIIGGVHEGNCLLMWPTEEKIMGITGIKVQTLINHYSFYFNLIIIKL